MYKGSGSNTQAYRLFRPGVIISVKKLNLSRMAFTKSKKRRKYFKGSMSRGLVIRSKVNYSRTPGVFVRFDENTIVLVNKKVVPVSNRVYGPLIKELCMKWPSLGCITRYII